MGLTGRSRTIPDTPRRSDYPIRQSSPQQVFFSDPNSPPEGLYREPEWYACRTRARAEKKVDGLLAAAGVTTYLPLVEKERRWSDRSKQVKFPLFPGYLFARFRLSALSDIVRTPGLIEVVKVNGYPTPLRESEIESVRSLVDGAREIGLEPSVHDYLVRGQEVKVLAGPFQGLQGILTEVRGSTRIVVRLEAIRQAVSVEMERQFVMPVSEV